MEYRKVSWIRISNDIAYIFDINTEEELFSNKKRIQIMKTWDSNHPDE